MKKIVLSLFVIVAVVSIASYGSYALWSDKETSEDNQIIADQMDLEISDNKFDLNNVYPSQEGSQEIKLKNISNVVNGKLSFSVKNVFNYENGCVEPESNTEEGNDTTCDIVSDLTDPNREKGELGDNVKFRIVIDKDKDGVIETEDYDSVTYKNLTDFNGTEIIILNAGEEVNAKVYYQVSNNITDPFADNIFMTDKLIFDVEFILTQAI